MPELSDLVIPLLIYCARIVDVSIGTIRMIMVISGHRLVSAVLGFVEVLVWVLAVGGVVKGGFDDPYAVIAFAGGYATGTLVGMTIERRLALGYRVVRVINPSPDLRLGSGMIEKGYPCTRIEGDSGTSAVEVLFFTIPRKRVIKLTEEIVRVSPDAFISVERAERVSGYVDVLGKPRERFPWGRFGSLRK